MDKNYEEAFAEVLEVIKNSNDSIKNKIPKKFIMFIDQNKDKNYIVKINFNNENWEDSLKPETLAILALIYRDYIVSKEDRKKLLIEEQNELTRIENELNERYNSNSIFENHNKNKQIPDNLKTNDVALTEFKESIFARIKNWLKQIFKK